jgi:hypothetical protein
MLEGNDLDATLERRFMGNSITYVRLNLYGWFIQCQLRLGENASGKNNEHFYGSIIKLVSRLYCLFFLIAEIPTLSIAIFNKKCTRQYRMKQSIPSRKKQCNISGRNFNILR